MDYEDIKQAFFVDQVHYIILYSKQLEASPLAKLLLKHGINDFYHDDLCETDIRTLGAGFCPVLILGSELIFDKDRTAVDALTHLLQTGFGDVIGYSACFFLIPPELLQEIIAKFLDTLRKNRNVLTASKGNNRSFYSDMRHHEVLTYAYFRTEPLPKATFRLR